MPGRIAATLALLLALVVTATAQGPGGGVYTPNPSRQPQFFATADGTAAAPAYGFSSNNGTTDQCGVWKAGAADMAFGNGSTGTGCTMEFRYNNSLLFALGQAGGNWNVTSAGNFVAGIDNNNDIGASGATRPRTLFLGTAVNSPTYLTTTNCANTGSPAVCAAAPAGSVVIAAAATSVVVNTTAVTANSQVFAMIDRSLGARLSVTCDTTSDLTTGSPAITARTAATSFTVAVPVAPAANPMCLSYFIVN